MKGSCEMDNPVSWFMLLLSTIVFLAWVVDKALKEKEKNERENDKFFEEYEKNRKF